MRTLATSLTDRHHESGKRPEFSVVVVSNDTGPRITGRQLGLAAVDLPDACRVGSEADPRDKKLRELRDALEKVELARPKLIPNFMIVTTESTWK